MKRAWIAGITLLVVMTALAATQFADINVTGDVTATGDIEAGTDGASQFLGRLGSANVPTYSFTGDPDTGFFRGSTGEIKVSSDTSIIGTWDSSGLVLEGTNLDIDNQGSVLFQEQSGNGDNYIGLQAPDAVTSNVTFKLPDGDGNNGQAIITDGSANLSWGEAGGGAGDNLYIDNNDFENDTTDWSGYDDGGAFVDGTGGTVDYISLAQTTTASEVLNGSGSLKVTKSASDASGEGFSVDSETIDCAHRGDALLLEFEWDGSASNYTADDIEVIAYDVTNSSELYVNWLSGADESGNLPNSETKVVGYVHTDEGSDCATGGTQTLRLAWHLESDSATGSSYDVFIDDVSLGVNKVVPGSIVTEWQTTTCDGSWTSNATYTCIKKRVGDDLIMDVTVSLSGAPNSTTLDINLPSGLTIDTDKLSSGTDDSQASDMSGEIDDDTGSTYPLTGSSYIDTNTLRPEFSDSSGNDVVTKAITELVPFTFANNDTISMRFRVPIDGWSSGASYSTTENLFRNALVICEVSASTANSSFADNSFETVDYDNCTEDKLGAVTTGANWVFTAPADGVYLVSATHRWDSSTNLTNSTLKPVLNGSDDSIILNNDAAVTAVGSGITAVVMSKDDTLRIDARQIDSGVSARSIYTTSGYNRILITRLNDESEYSIYGEWERLIAAVSSDVDTSGTGADTFVDIVSLEVTEGTWCLGYNMPVSVYEDGGDVRDVQASISITDSGDNIVSNSVQFIETKLFAGVRQVFHPHISCAEVTVTEPTTYTVSIKTREASSAEGVFAVIASDYESYHTLTDTISGDDTSAVFFAERKQ